MANRNAQNSDSVVGYRWTPSEALQSEFASTNVSFSNCRTLAELTNSDARLILLPPLALADLREVLSALKKNPNRPKLIALIDDSPSSDLLDALQAAKAILIAESAVEAQLPVALTAFFHEQKVIARGAYSDSETAFEHMVAASPSMKHIFTTIEKVAEFNTTVLIQGESGTGKELIARAIHSRSPRRNKPFVALNCGAIPENLLESELFGHRKGSFTDASKDKLGLLEEADGGTVFLDEIGELQTHLQVKLLRVLQEQTIHPIGAPAPIPVDIRVVAATLRDLEQDVEDGSFRDDLYYRLNVVPITVPPLRERPEDIDVLLQHFLASHRSKLGLPVYQIDDEAQQALKNYPWPGNVRELENALERAMILCKGDSIDLGSLPSHIQKHEQSADAEQLLYDKEIDSLSIRIHRKNLEIFLITKALEQTDGNRTHAAKLLEVSHRTLLNKLKEYEL